ncbi:LysR family transcriptional regulator [Lactobacillus xylocopicola]|uniref:LysR family transcriptional regulator n=1 Tax=Lactobacillus xylocopicola TaxID=2976676 RepID=A0ABN6SKG8_9LACO|nr:LysR family transcriptional regulator [Lactobacillus xylocopicola]BDR60770.1 LysR family transcriptional regulator [Lactobacillus xylocopicola]
MDNRLLTFLETLENSNSVSEAAKKLYLTQPYLSRTIKKYEKEYNVLLVKRDTYPIQLTPAGQLLIRYLRKDLQLKNQLQEEMKQYKKNNFLTLRMGVTPPLGQNFNLVVLPQLLAKYPHLKTKTRELSTADAVKAFKDEQLDLFVGNTIRLPNIVNENLHADAQVLVLSRKSALYQSGKRKIEFNAKDLQALNHESFIVVDGQRGYQDLINDFFSNMGINFYPQIHVRDSYTALKLADLGLGDMTTSIEAVNREIYHHINYIVLPPDKIKVDFSISTIKSGGRLATEIAYAKKILKSVFTTEILAH